MKGNLDKSHQQPQHPKNSTTSTVTVTEYQAVVQPKEQPKSIMFSERFFQMAGKYLSFYSYLSATPILLDTKTNRLITTKSTKFRFNYIVVPILVMYTFILIIQTFHLYKKRGKNFYFTCVYSLCAQICCITLYTLVAYQDELVKNMNSIIDLLVDIQGNSINFKIINPYTFSC